jgi:hypothetical protein
MMENLIVESTKKTPEVSFKINGQLLIKGRSIPEDPNKFYDALLHWVTEYAKTPQPKTDVHVELEYFNSGTSKALLHILRALTELKQKGNDLKIRWFYEAGDDDIYERGDYYASLLETDFEFIEMNEE